MRASGNGSWTFSEAWIERAVEQINEHKLPHAYLYKEDQNLPHYRNLFREVWRLYGDKEASLAAFFHGLRIADIPDSFPVRLVSKGVRAILEGRENLLALDAREHDVEFQLVRNVLPNLPDVRSAILLVLDQIDHLDPDGLLSSWGQEFHRNPQASAFAELTGRYQHSFRSPEDQALFADSVVRPTAEVIGLWHERNVAHDASLYYRNRARFWELVEFACHASRPGGRCERAISLVRKRISAGRDTEVRWEWRHVAGMDEKLQTGKGQADLERHLQHLGFVTIVCPREDDCYKVFGRLQSSLSHPSPRMFDSHPSKKLTGYRAIHTSIDSEQVRHLGLEGLPVKIMQRSSDPIRYEAGGKEQLKALRTWKRGGGGIGMFAFAPDGKRIDLPLGATVLNFAHKLHAQLLLYVRGAKVHRRHVSCLHLLNKSDVVWLVLGEDPQPLPPEWKDLVPPSTVTAIERDFRHEYRLVLRGRGRQRLMQLLRERGLACPDDPDRFGKIAEHAGSLCRADLSADQPRPAVWWYEQLGIFDAIQSGEEIPFSLGIDEKLRRRFILRFAQMMDTPAKSLAPHLETTLDLANDPRLVRLCIDCNASVRGMGVATLGRDRIVLHRLNRPCGQGGTEFKWRKSTTEEAYLIAEIENRVGMASRILSVLARNRIDITDLVGRSLNNRTAVVRIRLRHPELLSVRGAEPELRSLSGIRRLALPGDSSLEDLEQHLPGRPHKDLLASRLPAPYVSGPSIAREAYFYGMERQLAQLHTAYQLLGGAGAHPGVAVLVTGPKRTGKSSLVLQFQRELARKGEVRPFFSYRRASKGMTWPEVLQLVVTDLAHAAGEADYVADGRSCRELVRELQRIRERTERRVVVAIDEAVALFDANGRFVEDILQFHDTCLSLRDLMLIWIGPLARISLLQRDLRKLLLEITSVQMTGLTFKETRDLVEARKLGPRLRISVPVSQASRLHTLTDGNPYWLTAICQKMWTELRPNEGEVVQYDPAAFDRAVETLVFDKEVFVDRVSGAVSDSTAAISKLILAALARVELDQEIRHEAKTRPGPKKIHNTQKRQGKEKRHGMKDDELIHMLGLAGHELNEAQLERAMLELSWCGAVKEAGGKSWKIQSPLLAKHIDFYVTSTPDDRQVSDGQFLTG